MRLAALITAAFAITIAACAQTQTRVTRLAEAPAKPADCALETFGSLDEIQRPHQVVCEIEAETPSSGYGHTGMDALRAVRPKACACGADALVLTHVESTGVRAFSWGQGVAIVKAVRYTE